LPAPSIGDAPAIEAHTRAWVERAVVGLNLCPFAKAPMVKGQIRYVVSPASDVDALCVQLSAELLALAQCDPLRTETTLLIHPWVLEAFDEFNDFLDVADACLESLELDGVLQIASFHPDYRFAGTSAGDITNATNRSPYPTLHLLREDSIERAVAVLDGPQAVFEANIATLERLGTPGWAEIARQCRRDAFGS
jgi:hypothetical protein